MSDFSTEIQPKLREFILELNRRPKYANIDIEVTFSANNGNAGIQFDTNAGLWLSNSNMCSKEIVDYIESCYNDYSKQEPVSVSIRCKRKLNGQNKLNSNTNISTRNLGNANMGMEQAIFVVEEPKFKLDDVILPEDTVKKIQEAIATVECFDLVYNKWNFRSKEPSAKTNICLFGVPGTGKTMCAHAIANSLGKKILIASYADIQSQYVGVGPKNLKAVFQTAEEHNALLFFDEADSFLRKRTSDNSSSASMHYNSMTNEMMKHLEDFNGIVIFATNLTENTDEAFKTRLSFSIQFKEPDEDCRAKIIERMIPSEVPLLEEFTTEDFVEMSKVCDGFVGRDIRNSIKTILSVGAQQNTYPFTKAHFLEGFKDYRDTKNAFDKSCNSSKTKTNPLDIYTTNGCIHNLLTYSAWVDGKENALETEYLKLFSKVLTRNKLIINSIDDLPDFEEICHEVTEESQKMKLVRYFCFFMAITNQDDDLYNKILTKLSAQLSLNEDSLLNIREYYKQAKLLSMAKESIS